MYSAFEGPPGATAMCKYSAFERAVNSTLLPKKPLAQQLPCASALVSKRPPTATVKLEKWGRCQLAIA